MHSRAGATEILSLPGLATATHAPDATIAPPFADSIWWPRLLAASILSSGPGEGRDCVARILIATARGPTEQSIPQ